MDVHEALLKALRDDGADLFLVRVLKRSRTVLDRSGFPELLGEEHIAVSHESADDSDEPPVRHLRLPHFRR